MDQETELTVIVVPDDVLNMSVLAKSRHIELQLSENGSTGYIWMMNEPGPRILADRLIPNPDTKPGAIGASYVRSFSFLGPAQDDVMTVDMRLVRPWENEVHQTVRICIDRRGSTENT